MKKYIYLKKYIYYNKDIRCRIKYVSFLDYFELQLQKKNWLFWFDIQGWYMAVSEGFWGESKDTPMLRLSYQFGHTCEAYMTGTLNIPKRVNEFFHEYFADNKKQIEGLLKLNNIK